MAASSTFFSPSLFLCVLVLIDITLAVSLDTDMKLKSENNNHLQNQETWPQQPRSGHHHKHGLAKKGRVLALPVRGQPAGEEALRVGSGAPAMEELVPLGQPAALKQDKDKDVFLGFELPHAERENQSPGSERGKKQNREQRRHSRRDRLKHHRGKTAVGPSSLYKKPESFEQQFQNLQAEEATSPTPTVLPFTALDLVVSTEEPPVLPATSPRSQARLRQDGDVMPTLDMALFDWTDYEDLKPEMWPSAKKKEKRRSKSSNGGNETSSAEGEPCDHHLDCLPGSCCDLREHLCKPHNRGLNNKCYDDCMCTEGLRCYAKFHRNRRVTRRKGRCVEPESANGEQGSFINV
uniref:Draxin n=1 Tax=Gallus gallus TaxID=9031 RepID=DRAXI_CHICK|nr:RecName: Full=Draxin; AltName: Full=Dorsal inhibitory axon guidance protein; AltName: Full=Dorsal repulsive axon guidance protein; Flags: Precursor [Gallus gallus]BAH02787.1 draxin [Gallus gallus]|eukprot:NP_001136320.1 draxin precursor [Gallus gallus]